MLLLLKKKVLVKFDLSQTLGFHFSLKGGTKSSGRDIDSVCVFVVCPIILQLCFL